MSFISWLREVLSARQPAEVSRESIGSEPTIHPKRAPNAPDNCVLRDRRWGKGEHDTLEAHIKGDGSLVLSGCYSGPSVEERFGDSDYEYWFTIRAPHISHLVDLLGGSKDVHVLDLLEERFRDENSTSLIDRLHGLKQKGFPIGFHSYI